MNNDISSLLEKWQSQILQIATGRISNNDDARNCISIPLVLRKQRTFQHQNQYKHIYHFPV